MAWLCVRVVCVDARWVQLDCARVGMLNTIGGALNTIGGEAKRHGR